MNTLDLIDIKAQAGLCASSFHGARCFLTEIRTLIAAKSVECDNCGGSGEVMLSTSHLGPDDYDYGTSCGKCDGDGSLPVITPELVKHLQDAIEGECNGLSIEVEPAKKILQFVLKRA